jgi:hypothetical protein
MVSTGIDMSDRFIGFQAKWALIVLPFVSLLHHAANSAKTGKVFHEPRRFSKGALLMALPQAVQLICVKR